MRSQRKICLSCRCAYYQLRTIALNLPDFVFASLREEGGDIVRSAEQTRICGLYREGRLSSTDAMNSLGITSRIAFETLVARHHAERDWTDEEVSLELETIQQRNHP
ncbi:uncharacterized protein UPF0175 [Prosthecobacter fusiformis]|uniref:Uncharacterized protein UPF0175 n=1 Tax=Prosthecobacter fusiformis TaxID=48464 RepID=A0A4R7S732_9BACT|nr:UPF0175 family protein [Prosthecobacter fusiformis]TDU73388.1 uncharacterized protein UPF0175 [Prosthecobacter fusiformis]